MASQQYSGVGAGPGLGERPAHRHYAREACSVSPIRVEARKDEANHATPRAREKQLSECMAIEAVLDKRAAPGTAYRGRRRQGVRRGTTSMDRLKLHSPNLTERNVARLAELFPGCVTEADGNGKV